MLLGTGVPVPKSLLTTLGLLSLLICCSGQWGFASNCSATIRLDQIFASNVTGNYIAVLEIDLEYLGSETLPVGQYGFNISCPSYLKALDTTGWTATGQDSGTISGMVYLTSPMQRFERNYMTMTIVGNSPQRFYPTAISFNGEGCFQQQLK
ncbi:g3225 [Coccomyxa viridis]|uniref:G3225 protein n=1 Tax=Coccomyxa viridis TaxID=1274662 RepID=A0ABP1FMA1_9CHLO